MTDEEAQPLPTSDPTARWIDLRAVGTVVHNRIQFLQRGVLDNRADGVAALARLRRGLGKTPGSVSDILQYTLADEFVNRDAKDEDDPTDAERAAHISLTLYALHQQSRGKPMHQRGWGVGRAVRRLHPEEPGATPGPVLRRFQALGTSADLEELVHHARGMVQLLRGKEIPLDYAVFADDLVRWQRPGGASAVRLRWGREFYRTRPAATDSL